MSDQQRPFPIGPLLGAGGLVLFSLISVALIQWFGGPVGDDALKSSPVLASRSLNFEDTADGAVRVLDADSGELIASLSSGEHGFVRATLRGLVRARRARGLGPEVPFVLEQRASGQLLLIDPTSGQEVDLWAFGSLNARVFSGFLQFDSSAGPGPDSPAALAHSSNRSEPYEQ